MAGLYIHIPFCKDACHYCDFHFSISLGQLSPMIAAIEQEISLRHNYLNGEALDTIYLGGGTPSLLSPVQLNSLFRVIKKNYPVQNDAEITLEANPDDLNRDYLEELKKVGINRISIGIQSFHEDDLQFMNRRHDHLQSHLCLELAREAGFMNLNLDLIYGLPGLTMEKWEENLAFASHYMPEHIAAYHLSYEPGSVLDYRRLKSRFKESDERNSLNQYLLLVQKLEEKGYQHYEISNFALAGCISRHNTAYWKGEKYLGVGPSAHSFNGIARRWNISRNASYVKFISEGSIYYEEEELDQHTRFHDYLMTSLRTVWGADLEHISREYGPNYYEHAMQQAKPFLNSGKMKKKGYKLILSREGMFIADHIISDLFL